MPINVSMMGTAPDKFRVDNKCAQRRLCPSYKAILWEGEVTPSLENRTSPSARASPSRMAQVTYPHGRQLRCFIETTFIIRGVDAPA